MLMQQSQIFEKENLYTGGIFPLRFLSKQKETTESGLKARLLSGGSNHS